MQPPMISATDALSEARRWYEAQVDAVARAWEQRFRHGQYRPDVPTDGDGDHFEKYVSPFEELADALEEVFHFEENMSLACLVVAVSPSADQIEDDQLSQDASWVMANDVLEHAARLGFFAAPCPEALRFPDLPRLSLLEGGDDFVRAERDLESARYVVNLMRNTVSGLYSADEREKAESRVAAAERHLDAIRTGVTPAFTEEHKKARHEAQRRQIVADYRDRLARDGMDVNWIETPSSTQEVQP